MIATFPDECMAAAKLLIKLTKTQHQSQYPGDQTQMKLLLGNPIYGLVIFWTRNEHNISVSNLYFKNQKT